MRVISLFLESSSNTQSFLWKFFSGRLSPQSPDSLVLHDIMFLLLNLSLCPVNCSLLSLFSSEMMLQNLLYLHSTEVHTKSWKDLRNFYSSIRRKIRLCIPGQTEGSFLFSSRDSCCSSSSRTPLSPASLRH